MRALISGGGTGGHVYPALAVATQLQSQYQAEVLFLGSDDGLENEIVPAAGFRFASIKAGKLRRYVSWQTVTGVMRVPIGMAQALQIVRKFQPDVAFTGGGYVAVPAALAARLNNVPFLMHQVDVPPNLSNKLMAPLSNRISVAFADSLAYFPRRKTTHLGNPVRQAILDARQLSPQEARNALGLDKEERLLLVTGGSQGARHLNQTVCRALPELLRTCQVLQVSGKELFAETREMSQSILANEDESIKGRYRLEPYLNEEMATALQAADLVLCRAGATTLSELAVLGKPSILVPLPPAIGKSPQEANAEMFRRKDAAQVLLNDELTPQKLVECVSTTIESLTALVSMSKAVRTLAKPDATHDIATAVFTIAKVKIEKSRTDKSFRE